MNYKGYNIAVHELGHNVEQVFSLYDVDYTLLAGVPNNAFTEALAFTFQANDMELLKLGKPSADQERMHALETFWSTWEIAGVALVETDVWHWLYDHPNATAKELREATVSIAKKYYAPVLGAPDSALLGIYSHTIGIPLYLPDYPIGHLIAFQIEEHVRKRGKLGPDFERMTKLGCVLPDLWMKHATGAPISAAPLLQAVDRALAAPAKP
jgi:oligoendopeptidase F